MKNIEKLCNTAVGVLLVNYCIEYSKYLIGLNIVLIIWIWEPKIKEVTFSRLNLFFQSSVDT